MVQYAAGVEREGSCWGTENARTIHRASKRGTCVLKGIALLMASSNSPLFSRQE